MATNTKTKTLTFAERQILALIRQGKNTAEIGYLLYKSPKTVHWHIGNMHKRYCVCSRVALLAATTGLKINPDGTMI